MESCIGGLEQPMLKWFEEVKRSEDNNMQENFQSEITSEPLNAPSSPPSPFSSLCSRIQAFNDERDWNQFHTPENLAKSISIEANELLECFQWDAKNFNMDEVKEELADVANYCIQMAQVLHLDLLEIINQKMDKNEQKYPVEKARGVSTKYTKL